MRWRVEVTVERPSSISVIRDRCSTSAVLTSSGKVAVMGVVSEESGVILMGDGGCGCSIGLSVWWMGTALTLLYALT